MAVITRETLPVVDAIAEELERRGLAPKAAAPALGVSFATLYNWLGAKTTPPLNADTQQNIARFLGVSPRRVVELFALDLSDQTVDSGAEHSGP